MRKLPPGQLSKHKLKGYLLRCGSYVGTDGKRRPKVFWLGHDLQKAQTEATKIEWAAPFAAVMGGWTKEYELRVRSVNTEELVRRHFQDAERARLQLTPHIPAPVVVQLPPPTAIEATPAPASASPPLAAATPMLHAAFDAYLAAENARNTSPSHKRTMADSFKALKVYRPGCPLAEIDFAWLQTLSSELKARPLSRKKDARTGRRMPIKPYTVRRLLGHLGRALTWIGRHRESKRFGAWCPPSDWRYLCTVEISDLMSKKEKDKAADGPEQLTIVELVKIYHAACQSRPRLHPILFLLGLFAGMGQTELSTATRDEFDLESSTFCHRRNKTSVRGEYWLPPELVLRLREYFKEHAVPSGEPVFRNRGGSVLVNNKSDAVGQAWVDWRKRSGVHRHGLGFYSLRRFWGDYATRVGGPATGDVALAHTAKSVRERHYSGYRDFDSVKAAGQQLHAELTQAGMFTPPPTAIADEEGGTTECTAESKSANAA